jgi:hypothetical protein
MLPIALPTFFAKLMGPRLMQSGSHLACYAGWLKAMAAMAVAKQVFTND